MTQAPREYVLGTAADELERLGIQHRLWGASAHDLWRLANIEPGRRVLDVGCGPGHASMDLAMLVGTTGSVVGIDESAGFIDHLNAQAAARSLRQAIGRVGDVMDLPHDLLEGSFDAAWIRWVLCFLPKPEATLAQLARAIRPGGRVAIQDYFNYESMTLAPRLPELDTVVRAVGRSWRSRGGDPDVMARIPACLDAAGFDLVSLEVRQRICRPGEPLWQWPTTFWRTFVPRLVASGDLSKAEAEAFATAWTRVSGDPHVWMQLPTVYEIVAQRRGG